MIFLREQDKTTNGAKLEWGKFWQMARLIIDFDEKNDKLMVGFKENALQD